MENCRIAGEWEVDRLPTITLVTPVCNDAGHVEAAIRSVLEQGYPRLEYFVMDCGSGDGTREVIERYAPYLAQWRSAPDGGQYAALDAAFARSTGEVMGWLNSDDLLHPNALWSVAEIFRDLDEVEWLLGRPTLFDRYGRATVPPVERPRWSRYRVLSGDFRWIQQESVFWRRRLWLRAGGGLSQRHRLAADFELWLRFFRHAPLYSTTALIGGFRLWSEGQRSVVGMADYLAEVAQLLAEEPLSRDDRRTLRRLRWLASLERCLPGAGWLGRVSERLYRYPPMIHYDDVQQRYRVTTWW